MDFYQLSLLIVVASGFGIVARLLRQPLLVGYLVAGVVLASLGIVTDGESLNGLGQIGVTLLLFLLGMEMKLSELPSIGKVALLTGIGQIIFTSVIGFFIVTLLGFGILPAVYIAVALTFSSTIIMVKLLSEKKDLNSLYGRISVGFLLIQDFVAIIILMFLSGLGSGVQSPSGYVFMFLKVFALFFFVWILSKKVIPKFFEKVATDSSELILIVSIAWALGLASFIAGPVGFSLEIGGFLAGIAFSNLPEHLQIASRAKPLRDFFLTIFFLVLGTHLVIGGGAMSLLPVAIVLSLFVLIGNPLIVLAIMGFLGYKKRTSFLSGLTVAQISEFSLILMSMGLVLGHVDSSHVSLITLVGVITMTLSTYAILESEKIFKKFSKYLSIFEKSRTKEGVFVTDVDLEDHIVLVGCDRTGRNLYPYLVRKKVPFVVVDFNPEVFSSLSAQNIPVVFGDIGDEDIAEAVNIASARLVISTISKLVDNLTILESLQKMQKEELKPATIFTANDRAEAVKLYEKGAGYVIVPEVVAGDYIRHLIRIYGSRGKRLRKAGKIHFNRLIFA